MKMVYVKKVILLLMMLASQLTFAGPYAPPAGQPGSTAIINSSSLFQGWASGYQDLIYGTDVDLTWQTPEKALGASSLTNPSFDILSLGNGGQITLTFDGAIYNGPGADFAVFENSFSDTFLELAYVEVSSDGNNFFRFENYSYTQSPVSAFGSVDATNLSGYAGKYRAGYGTPFDLDEFSGTAGLDIDNILYVRLLDIVGDGTYFDDFPGNHPIYDPYNTTGSGGFDLEALGVIHLAAVPLPASIYLFMAAFVFLLSRTRTNHSYN
jgi:hypothetical protein